MTGLVASGSPAGAATLFAKFYAGTTGYTGTFSGPGTVYNDTKSLATACPSTGSCSSDNLNTTLTFTSLGITATVNNSYKVWDDLAPNFGGLGVGTGLTGSDTNDNINIVDSTHTNILTLTFSSAVHLTGVGTLFDAPHAPFGNGSPTSGTTGFFLLNGNPVSFTSANDEQLNLTGTVFTFAEDTTSDPTFYVSALSYTPTPLPAALPLFATGLGALGLFGWRRKRKNAAAIAASR